MEEPVEQYPVGLCWLELELGHGVSLYMTLRRTADGEMSLVNADQYLGAFSVYQADLLFWKDWLDIPENQVYAAEEATAM